jgi:hypothetical protein
MHQSGVLGNALNENKANYAADACCEKAVGSVGMRPTTIADQLEKNADGSYRTASDYSRAAHIMRTHPEFEDLIWLIRSGLI